MTNTIATRDFDRLRARVQASLLASTPEQIERLGWSADRIGDHQRTELRHLVAHAIEHSPFHRRRLAGVRPESLELTDLPSFPVMTKADMMDELDDVLTDPRVRAADAERALRETTTEPVPIASDCFAMASGGSSGRRGVFCYDHQAAVAFFGSLSRTSAALLRSMGGPPSDGITVAMVCAPSAVHATGNGPAFTAGSEMPFHFVPVPVTLPMPEIVERLNELRAPLLYGYASVLARLAREQLEGRLHLSLVGVTSTSETLLPELRHAIRDGFGVPIVNTFGSTEGLVGVSGPDEEVLVFNSDCCIVELVDEQNRPVAAGIASAKVLVTNLTNRLQPLIRYELTDRFVQQPAVPEHGHLRALVDGRADDELRFGGVSVHPLVIRSVMVKTPAVVDYQIRQTPRGIDVDTIAQERVDTAELRERLEHALTGAGLPDPLVTVRPVERLQRDERTGKVRRFQPLP